MNRPMSIVGAIRSVQTRETESFFARVISVSPITIQPENDEKRPISGKQLVIPQHLTDYEVDVEAEGEADILGGSMTGSRSGVLTISGGTVSASTKSGEGSHSHPDTSSGGSHTHTLGSFSVSGATASETDVNTQITGARVDKLTMKLKLKVKNALKVGDRVMVVCVRGERDKHFYVLDREG